MDPLPSSDRPVGEEARLLLLDAAERSIRSGLAGEGPLVPGADSLDAMPPSVLLRRGVFVTVKVDGELNGCIGSLEPRRSLAVAVPTLAWEAAFADPRLPALTWPDEPGLGMKVSVLSPLEPLGVASQPELLAALRPGVDGLLIAAGLRRATFLPSVWETLPDPLDFVRHLQTKAMLPRGEWLAGTKAYRYTALEFGRDRSRTTTPVIT
jgi:AmmeMemoRadiSam system protein A